MIGHGTGLTLATFSSPIPTLVAHASWLGASWLRGENLAVAAVCGMALAAGDAARSRRDYLAEVEERARRAEHDRENEAQRRVTEERLRIARDLHDSMGHHIALISAHAGLAGHVFHDQPATAKQALAHIRQAGRAALDDLQDTIGLLRRPGEPAAPTEPTLGASSLGDLVATFRESGMRIDYDLDGQVRSLPPAVNLTAYRVVQESLTNVRKHSGGEAARVRLSFQPAALELVIEDEGNRRPDHRADVHPLPGQDGAGHGIVGMRERVSAVGGSLDAGSRHGGGFPGPRGAAGAGGRSAMTVRVLLVDDQPLLRMAFKGIIDSTVDLTVVGEASTGREAVELARLTRADVVLMDIRLPDLDGLTATRLITKDEDLAGVNVLIVTTFNLDEYVFQALRAGASGFVGKGVEPDELIEAIRVVERGDALLSPAATKALISRFLDQADRASPQASGRLTVLTHREREILALVGAGLSNDEIAQSLVISLHTAKTHVKRAMVKLGAHDRAQLVVIAYETGLVHPGTD